MDSLTQFALGATVSALCLGKTLGPRKAAVLGGILGTLPDLDVFIPFDNPVDSFVLHRGWTHSLFIHALATPILGELLVRSIRPLHHHRSLVWWTVFLCLSTHALIDAMTVYGTRLFWPIYPDPVGVGSIFIIDPLYTLPLLAAVILALTHASWSPRLGHWLRAALVVSSAYMGIGVVLQAHAEERARAVFTTAGIETDRVFAIASPFNTVLWKVIGLQDDRYHNLYISPFDDDLDATIYSHPRQPELVVCLNDNEAFKKLEWFSKGFYRAELEGDKIVVSDLRMGLTPNYVFRFAIAERAGETVRPIMPTRASDQPRASEGDLAWLVERVLGRPAVRIAERVDPQTLGQIQQNAC